ncbi:hypothetical protein Pla52o_27090 [Novipirellula galeiformis]|uniref:Uncharacterized protein n=1 Tax=Novipirellula galeiformis TaxID=2528004 RepID=A0A5C6CI44_9BACT|nr:hypothetical protein Pla52o_27090 [Novipirellula galeiformis]
MAAADVSLRGGTAQRISSVSAAAPGMIASQAFCPYLYGYNDSSDGYYFYHHHRGESRHVRSSSSVRTGT